MGRRPRAGLSDAIARALRLGPRRASAVGSGGLSIAVLALRAYVRYLVPLTLLSAVTMAPAGYLALRAPAPPDGAAARMLLATAWLIAGTAWIGQLLAVAAATPAVAGLAAGAPPSQLRALRDGVAQLVRALLPWSAACAAIAIGLLALALPGVLLLGLLSLAGASRAPTVAGALADSVAVARANARAIAVVAGAMIAFDLGLVLIAQQLLVATPIVKQPAADQLEAVRLVVRIAALGAVVASPLLAAALAAIHVHHRGRAR